METRYILTHKQDEAFEYLTNDLNEDVLYGGAKGGGKSFLLSLWAFQWTKHLIDFFGIKDIRHPLPVGFIGRKRSADFTKTTLETFKKVIPFQSYHLKEHDKEIIINNKAKILYGGLDDEININKFNSAELAFFAVDQAEETDRRDVSILESTLRLKHEGKQPPYKSLYTANPAECWLKEDFVNRKRKRARYIKALPTDNPHLPYNYLDQLEKAFSYDPALLEAYKEGNWEVMATEHIVIPSKYLDDLKGIVSIAMRTKRCLSCDPATGGDECVIYVMENYNIIDQKILHYDDPMKIVGEIMILLRQHRVRTSGIDAIGIGAGVVSRLAEMGADVYSIESAEKATNPERFANRRAEMWWKVRETVMNRDILYPQDEELRRQLSSVRYKVIDSNGKIQIESKKEIRKRLGRSPDRADAFVYAIWTMEQVEPVPVKSRDYGLGRRTEEGMPANIRGY